MVPIGPCVVSILYLGFVRSLPLSEGTVVFVQKELSPLDVEVEATDGTVYIRAVGTNDTLNCTVTANQKAVQDLLNDRDATIIYIGEEKIEGLKRTCNEKHVFDVSLFPLPYIPFPPEETGTPKGAGNSILILPGTRWCGESNVAGNYSDLGTSRKADACCRAHDQCPYFIGPFQTKYNYRNLHPWTLSLCDCDRALYHCLKDVHSGTAEEVGEAFFGLLDVDCFTFENVKYCAKYHWTQLWCEEKGCGPAAVVRKLGLKWPMSVDQFLGK